MGTSHFIRSFENKNDFSICKVFAIYWIVLIIWQNAFGNMGGAIADAMLKILLLVYLTFSFFRVNHYAGRQNLIILLSFMMTQLLTFFLCDFNYLSLGILVNYLYPSLFLFLVYCVGAKFVATKNQVEKMNSYILAVLVISVLYTIIFEPDQYMTAISAKGSGYGNELCSFFYSMHEYALYLFYGITVCINRIEENTGRAKMYWLAMVVFGTTMLFTFSRTAILGCIVYLLIYMLLNRKTRVSKMLSTFFLLFAVIALAHSGLRNYLFEVVWKSGDNSSRDSLMDLAADYYNNGTWVNKLFGFGIVETRAYFEKMAGYGSIHNGFVQVLIYYGVVGLTFMCLLLASQLLDCIRFFGMNQNIGVQSIALLVFCMLAMLPQTFIIFTSSIDCFFLTAMFVIVPKYQRNAVRYGQYAPEQ